MGHIIICTNLVPLQIMLAHKLIPSGFNIIKLNTLDEIYSSIPAQGNICLLDDNNLDKKQVLKFLTEIKRDEKKKGCRIVLLTGISDSNVLKVFTQIGVDAVLQGSLHLETIVEKFSVFLQKIQSQHSERKYIRFKPDKADEAVLRLLNGNKYIAGEITDISMGGIAVKFPAAEIESIKDGSVYSNSQILISKKTVVADIKLVKKGGDLAAFSYDKIRDSFRDILTEYIYSKVQKDLTNINQGQPALKTEKEADKDNVKEKETVSVEGKADEKEKLSEEKKEGQ